MNVPVGSNIARATSGICQPASPSRAGCRMGRLGAIVLAVVALAWASPSTAADQTVWPLTPYQVQVFVAVERQPPLAPRLEASLCDALSARIDAVLGAAFNAEVAPAPPALFRDMVRGLSSLQADDVPAPASSVDKILLVAVTTIPGGMAVTARDFDVRTRVLGMAVSRPVWQVGALGETAFSALLAAFAPIARIERLEKDNTAVLRPKAIGLPLGDRTLALLRDGDVLQPITRTNDRLGNFRKATVAPWSFVVVEKVGAEEVRGRVYSGMRAAMSAKGRGRIESLALRVVPPGGSTTLVLKSRTEPKIPLGGYDIYTVPPGGKTPVLLGVTDRQGRLAVSSDASVLRVLMAKSGKDLLAKLPMVPGLEPRLTAEVPNHDRRLEAEGFLFGLQEELVDLFARRKILMARIEMRMQEGQFDQAAELMDELNRLPRALQFTMRIAQQQDRLVSPDKRIQKKIDKLLEDTRQQVEKCLGSDEIEALDRQVRAGRCDPQPEATPEPKSDGNR
ncbi:MAG: hypothetical protein ABFC63_09105 [Thermoguttaceae bacterium]